MKIKIDATVENGRYSFELRRDGKLHSEISANVVGNADYSRACDLMAITLFGLLDDMYNADAPETKGDDA